MILPCPDSKHSFVLFAKQGCHWCGRNTLNPEMSNDDDGNDGDDNNHMIMTMMIGCVLECGLWHWVSLADRADCPDLVPSHELKIRRNSSDEDHDIYKSFIREMTLMMNLMVMIRMYLPTAGINPLQVQVVVWPVHC